MGSHALPVKSTHFMRAKVHEGTSADDAEGERPRTDDSPGATARESKGTKADELEDGCVVGRVGIVI